jgi:hypothetical protein
MNDELVDDFKLRFDVEYRGTAHLIMFITFFLKRMFPEITDVKLRLLGKRE